jgi:putative membrane protein
MDRRVGRECLDHVQFGVMKKLVIFFALSDCMMICATAQDKSSDTTARYFIIQASIGNLQEIAMGRLAAAQATSPDVKAFANKMVADHAKAEAQLMQLVQTRGFRIPHEATDPPVEDMMLKKETGKDFDRVYVHMMVPDHRQTVQLFEKYALTGKDPDVNAFAKQTLPILKEHLAAITAIDQSMQQAMAANK